MKKYIGKIFSNCAKLNDCVLPRTRGIITAMALIQLKPNVINDDLYFRYWNNWKSNNK